MENQQEEVLPVGEQDCSQDQQEEGQEQAVVSSANEVDLPLPDKGDEKPEEEEGQESEEAPAFAAGEGSPDNEDILRMVLEEIRVNAQKALDLLGGAQEASGGASSRHASQKARQLGRMMEVDAGRIIEGVFDGQNMVGPDGKKYSVAANYASKSKLVEGDLLKLTILSDGTFLYKQIGPQKRARLRGLLVQDQEIEDYKVLSEGRSYNVLTASVTYFKGAPGDDVIILVPEDGNSSWAAVENIIKKG